MSNYLATVKTELDNVTTDNVVIPAAAAGVELLAFIISSAGSNSSASMEGWSQRGDVSRTTNCRIQLFSKTAAGNEGGVQELVMTSATDVVARVFSYPAGSDLDVAVGVASNYYSGSAAAPVVTTVSTDTQILRAMALRSSTAVASAPNTPLLTVTQDTTSLAMGVQSQADAGDVSAESFSIANSGTNACLMTVAIKAPAAASAAIDSVGVDNTIADGSKNNILKVSGFTGDITGAKLKAGSYEISVLNLLGSGNLYAFDVQDIAALLTNTAGVPVGTVTFEATDGTNTATAEIQLNPKLGWNVAVVAGAISDNSSMLDQLYADGSKIYFDSSNGTTVEPTGVPESDATSFDAVIWDIDTGIHTPVTVTFGESGVVYASFITAVNVPNPEKFTLNKSTDPDQWENSDSTIILPLS